MISYFCNTNHHLLLILLIVFAFALEASFSALRGCYNHNELTTYQTRTKTASDHSNNKKTSSYTTDLLKAVPSVHNMWL